MRLSTYLITKDSADYVENLLSSLRSFADEIIVAVDASSTDKTEDAVRKYADKIFRIDHPGTAERARAWMNLNCEGDWILYLDDDERPSAQFVQALPQLMHDKEITHYWIRRRWLISGDRLRWIAQRPWWPDWQLRLMRNIPSIIRIPGRLHTNYVVQGGGRYTTEGAIYHYDLIYHSDTERQRKVLRYESLSEGDSLAPFYLISNKSAPVTRPIPPDDEPWSPSSEFEQRVTKSSPIRHVNLAELRRAGMQQYDIHPELFRATVEWLDRPQELKAGQAYTLDINIRNDSDIPWPAPGLGVPQVRIAYHWLRENEEEEMYQYEGHRTDLPHTLRPGEWTRVPATVVAPIDPGTFFLRWDLIIEGVSWFSTQGWHGPENKLEIIQEHDANFC